MKDLTPRPDASNISAVSGALVDLSPALIDYLKVREAEVTKRQAITAHRDIEISRIENFATVILASIEDSKVSKGKLIKAFSDGLKDAIAAGNTEVAVELSKRLASLGSVTAAIATGYAKITGRTPVG